MKEKSEERMSGGDSGEAGGEHCRPLELETCTCTEEGLLDTHQGQDVRSKRLSIMVEEEVLRSDV